MNVDASPAPWPPELPDVTRDWPTPRGVKRRPARWLSDGPDGYRAYVQAALDRDGPGALMSICNDAPRHPGSPLTRWFCPGVPMHATGETITGHPDGRARHVFLVPAQAALLALDAGHITCKPPTHKDTLRSSDRQGGS